MYSSDSVTPLRNVSVESGELTTKERFSICCKPSFQMRKLKNRGAILVLIWSFLCVSFFHFYCQEIDHHGIDFLVHSIVFGLTLSVAGWIADVCFGRYRVIKLSMWIMWAALMLATVSSVLGNTVDSYSSKIYLYVNGVLSIVATLGFGGFQANVIPFGIDQLYDASTHEITSFVFWHVWTYSSNSFIVTILCGLLTKQYWILRNLVMCICLSMALSSMLMFNNWLVKEPVTQNPFKLVYRVVRYAIKHKHPECRSAFTYCEDEPPSRIDFGKSKYGGPFTTEQVEDVKTFLRFVGLVFIAAIIFIVILASWQLEYKMFKILTDANNSEGKSKFFSNVVLVGFFSNCGVMVLPLYEFFFRPVFHRCLETVKSGWRFSFGMILLTFKIVSTLVIEIIVRHNYLEITNYNSTISCMDHVTLNPGVNIWWMAIPFLVDSLSVYVLSIAGLEFAVSQTPYSMRGLVMGTIYAMLVLSLPVGIGISVPFTKQLSIWGTGIISCGFWYALLLLVVEVLVGFMLIAMQRWYKKRKREDVLPNEHIFAERYYVTETVSCVILTLRIAVFFCVHVVCVLH